MAGNMKRGMSVMKDIPIRIYIDKLSDFYQLVKFLIKW